MKDKNSGLGMKTFVSNDSFFEVPSVIFGYGDVLIQAVTSDDSDEYPATGLMLSDALHLNNEVGYVLKDTPPLDELSDTKMFLQFDNVESVDVLIDSLNTVKHFLKSQVK